MWMMIGSGGGPRRVSLCVVLVIALVAAGPKRLRNPGKEPWLARRGELASGNMTEDSQVIITYGMQRTATTLQNFIIRACVCASGLDAVVVKSHRSLFVKSQVLNGSRVVRLFATASSSEEAIDSYEDWDVSGKSLAARGGAENDAFADADEVPRGATQGYFNLSV